MISKRRKKPTVSATAINFMKFRIVLDVESTWLSPSLYNFLFAEIVQNVQQLISLDTSGCDLFVRITLIWHTTTKSF